MVKCEKSVAAAAVVVDVRVERRRDRGGGREEKFAISHLFFEEQLIHGWTEAACSCCLRSSVSLSLFLQAAPSSSRKCSCRRRSSTSKLSSDLEKKEEVRLGR